MENLPAPKTRSRLKMLKCLQHIKYYAIVVIRSWTKGQCDFSVMVFTNVQSIHSNKCAADQALCCETLKSPFLGPGQLIQYNGRIVQFLDQQNQLPMIQKQYTSVAVIHFSCNTTRYNRRFSRQLIILHIITCNQT